MDARSPFLLRLPPFMLFIATMLRYDADDADICRHADVAMRHYY